MEDFTNGLISGLVICFIVGTVFLFIINNIKNDVIEKRCIEMNCGEYVNEEFHFTNNSIKYILEGKHE